MKHVKSLALAGLVAAALMAFGGSGTASATELYSGASTLGSGKTIDFSQKPGSSYSVVDTAGNPLVTCTGSTIKSKITNSGSSIATTTSEITEITASGCTFPTVTVLKGKLEFHHISGTTNATLTADAEIGVTFNTVFFGSCVYGVTAGTQLGTITNGTPATWDINAVTIKLSGSAFACPETTRWTGTSISTEPAGNLRVEAS